MTYMQQSMYNLIFFMVGILIIVPISLKMPLIGLTYAIIYALVVIIAVKGGK